MNDGVRVLAVLIHDPEIRWQHGSAIQNQVESRETPAVGRNELITTETCSSGAAFVSRCVPSRSGIPSRAALPTGMRLLGLGESQHWNEARVRAMLDCLQGTAMEIGAILSKSIRVQPEELRTSQTDRRNELLPIDRNLRHELLQAAREAARAAHCPYSRFHVGASVLAEGRIFPGCNVENASYGLTICAERVAIFNAVSAGCRRLQAIAVSCPDAAPTSPQSYRMPCGACRQVIAEFASEDLVVIIDDVGDVLLQELLPHPFQL